MYSSGAQTYIPGPSIRWANYTGPDNSTTDVVTFVDVLHHTDDARESS